MDFDFQPTLTSEHLYLRPLTGDDFEGLRLAASDPEIWAGHPVKDRHLEDVFTRYFDFLLGTKTTLAIIDPKSDSIIGCSRFYHCPPGQSVGIGFTFLNNGYWGGITNFRLKQLMLDYAFQTVDEVWFHIGPDNVRSQKATAKLGTEFVRAEPVDFGNGPADYYTYILRKSVWRDIRLANAHLL